MQKPLNMRPPNVFKESEFHYHDIFFAAPFGSAKNNTIFLVKHQRRQRLAVKLNIDPFISLNFSGSLVMFDRCKFLLGCYSEALLFLLTVIREYFTI